MFPFLFSFFLPITLQMSFKKDFVKSGKWSVDGSESGLILRHYAAFGRAETTKNLRKISPPVGRSLNTWLSVYEATTVFGEREVILSENVQVTTAAYLVYDAVLLRN